MEAVATTAHRVNHAREQHWYQLRQHASYHVLGDARLADGRPEFACFERDPLIFVNGRAQHVLDDGGQVWCEYLKRGVQQHHERLTYTAPDVR